MAYRVWAKYFKRKRTVLPQVHPVSEKPSYGARKLASAPARTGIARKVAGRDRDQLSSHVTLETCVKGKQPPSINLDFTHQSILGRRSWAHSAWPTTTNCLFLLFGKNNS